MDEKKISRRDFFKTLVRYTFLGGVAAAGGLLAERTLRSGESCVSSYICRSCGIVKDCGLPQALSFKAAAGGNEKDNRSLKG